MKKAIFDGMQMQDGITWGGFQWLHCRGSTMLW